MIVKCNQSTCTRARKVMTKTATSKMCKKCDNLKQDKVKEINLVHWYECLMHSEVLNHDHMQKVPHHLCFSQICCTNSCETLNACTCSFARDLEMEVLGISNLFWVSTITPQCFLCSVSLIIKPGVSFSLPPPYATKQCAIMQTSKEPGLQTNKPNLLLSYSHAFIFESIKIPCCNAFEWLLSEKHSSAVLH